MIKIDDYLKDIKTIAISGHIRPDGDCIGSTLGAYNYITENYPFLQVDLYLEDSYSDTFLFLHNIDKINSKYPTHEPYDLFLSLDSSDYERLGDAGKYFDQAKTTICVDHHISNQGFAQHNFIYPDKSSASEVLYEMLDENKISEKVAECIYLGMVHDTGVFQYSCTSARTMEIAGKMMELGIDYSEIVQKTFFAKTYAQNKIMAHAVLKSELHAKGMIISSVLTQEDFDKYQVLPKDLEGIVNQLQITKGVEVAIFLYQNAPDGFKASLRSNGKVDVAKICGLFGGGGHVRASGVSMTGDVKSILNKLIEEIKKQLT
ncbi:DHH family phosphoesterase [Eubacterium oxidoreducens]|uniref:Phosphoesterase RecJ domain-containing protein n=1 Tax=Eubacterium oxidoreducens TaxID=1732 RepID=A0A1G6ANI7_EUBOX|nr:bifunctional oligoribonuclease/PAP phosphatase NrnA [Eubacterium oxidoreducens]SDB09968.1 phosphoesterase RecJ domain-containing protein [Eubacterium oxidoreducens]